MYCLGSGLLLFHCISIIFGIHVIWVTVTDWIPVSYLIRYLHYGWSCDFDMMLVLLLIWLGFASGIFSMQAVRFQTINWTKDNLMFIRSLGKTSVKFSSIFFQENAFAQPLLQFLVITTSNQKGQNLIGHMERPETETATNCNSHKLEWPRTKTTIDRNNHKPKSHKQGWTQIIWIYIMCKLGKIVLYVSHYWTLPFISRSGSLII